MLVTILSATCCFSQTAVYGAKAKTKIAFNCACDDVVGSRYATAFRDLLAKSPRYEETDISKDAAWDLQVVSVDVDRTDSGHETAISFTINRHGLYRDSWVSVCGSNKVSSCAADDFSALDDKVQRSK
jgi:hypothetical protein